MNKTFKTPALKTKQYAPSKIPYGSKRLHGVTAQKITICILKHLKRSDYIQMISFCWQSSWMWMQLISRNVVLQYTVQETRSLPSEQYLPAQSNKRGNVLINENRDAFAELWLLCKFNTYYIFGVCVSILIYPSNKTHAPYRTVICGLSGSTIFSTSHKRQDRS